MVLHAVICVSRGRRGTSDALTRLGRHWTVDPRGRCGETCIWTSLRVRFTWQVWKVATGGVAKVDSRGRRGEACAVCVSPGRRGEWCDRWPRWASFCAAGAGNRVRWLESLDFVALCERARVRVLDVAKSWQAQGIRGFVDVSLEPTFLGTQRQAAFGASHVRRCAVERNGRLWGWASGVSRVWRVRVWVAPCHQNW